MVILFMILECFYSLLTLSLGPIASSVKKVFKLDEDYIFYLELCPLVAVVTGFYPTFKILNALGLKNGLSLCLLISLLGALAQYFTQQNKWLFLAGQFILLFGMQSLHTAKGVFVNVFFQEKNVLPVHPARPCAHPDHLDDGHRLGGRQPARPLADPPLPGADPLRRSGRRQAAGLPHSQDIHCCVHHARHPRGLPGQSGLGGLQVDPLERPRRVAADVPVHGLQHPADEPAERTLRRQDLHRVRLRHICGHRGRGGHGGRHLVLLVSLRHEQDRVADHPLGDADLRHRGDGRLRAALLDEVAPAVLPHVQQLHSVRETHPAQRSSSSTGSASGTATGSRSPSQLPSDSSRSCPS